MEIDRLSRREAVKTGIAAAVGVALGQPLFGETAALQTLPAVTKPIPSTGERIPVIGLGTNAYGVQTDEQKAPLREVLEHMPKIGGTVIDTARSYGRSEAVIGELLQSIGNRSSYFLATKTPITGDISNPQAQFDVSFQNLRTDRIDLMQIHNLYGLDAFMPVYEKAKAAGRIRYIGISMVEDFDELMAAMRKYPFDFIQVDYSIENREAAQPALELAQERRMAVLINQPFGGRRNAKSMFSRTATRALPPWATEFDATTWSHFFLKYVVSHPAVTAAIPGTTQLRHLQDNQGAGRGRLPNAEQRRRIEAYWDSVSKEA